MVLFVARTFLLHPVFRPGCLISLPLSWSSSGSFIIIMYSDRKPISHTQAFQKPPTSLFAAAQKPTYTFFLWALLFFIKMPPEIITKYIHIFSLRYVFIFLNPVRLLLFVRTVTFHIISHNGIFPWFFRRRAKRVGNCISHCFLQVEAEAARKSFPGFLI